MVVVYQAKQMWKRGPCYKYICTFFSVDNKTPLLKDLHKQITPLCAVRWREIGALLGLPTATLDDIIECNYRYRVRRCCYAMLKKWLAVDPTASWWKFLAVIESITVSGSAPDKGDHVCIVYIQ